MLLWVAVWLGLIGFLTGLGGHRDMEFTMWLSLPGFVMAYAAVTRFFNRLVIDVTPGSVAVHQTPLPWALPRRVSTCDVAAVRISVRTVHSRGTGPLERCRISLERTNGRTSTVANGLEMSALEMSGIAAAIGDFLGVPVRAE